MDDVAQYNLDRWEALARANAIFTRPRLELTPAEAQVIVDPQRLFGSLAGKDVLCLAGGGGQQSVAFALLGARVTVFDLSPAQLQRDRDTAAYYDVHVETIQGDMRDLSRLATVAFDIVCHPYSINFVPDPRVVFEEVTRVIRLGGTYYFSCANPFVAGLTALDWDGTGYPLTKAYIDGAQTTSSDQPWVFRGDVPSEAIAPSKEFKHTLSTLVNGLIDEGFVIQHLLEETLGSPDVKAAAGTVEHFAAIAPVWLQFWASYRPDP